MFCSRCGKEMNDSEKFCSECGQSFQNVVQNKTQDNQPNQQYGKIALIIIIVIVAILIFTVPMVKCGQMCVKQHTIVQKITGNANCWKK